MEIFYILASSHISLSHHPTHQVRKDACGKWFGLGDKRVRRKELIRPDLASTVCPQNLGLNPSYEAMTIN